MSKIGEIPLGEREIGKRNKIPLKTIMHIISNLCTKNKTTNLKKKLGEFTQTGI